MSTIAQARLAGATALMILLYLLQVVLFAPPSQADTHTHEDPGYWAGLYPNAVGCWTGGGDHGEVVEGGLAVELAPFEDDWVGDRWEVLIVNGGPEDGGDGHGNAIYELPVAGQAYYPPNDGGDQLPTVNHWIVCKGETPTEPGVAAVAVHADCVWDEQQAYFYADVLDNASLLVDLTGDGDFNDSGAGEKDVVPGSPGFIYPDTPAGGSIEWEATANAGFEFDGGETVVGGFVTVPDCTAKTTTTTTSVPTTTTTSVPTTTTPTSTVPTTTTPTTTTSTTTVPTTTTSSVAFDSVPDEEEDDGAEVLGATITTAPQEVSADTLPFTGFESGDIALLGLLAVLGGGLILLAVRRSEDDEDGAHLGTWSTF